MPPKISLIGAGSVVFARRLLQDVACTPSLRDSHISLMDIDEERLQVIGDFAKKLFAEVGSAARIETTIRSSQIARRCRLCVDDDSGRRHDSNAISIFRESMASIRRSAIRLAPVVSSKR